jgi:hypothetical protein
MSGEFSSPGAAEFPHTLATAKGNCLKSKYKRLPWETRAFSGAFSSLRGGFPRPHALSSRRKKRNKPNYECNTGRDDFDILKTTKAKPGRLMPSMYGALPSGIAKVPAPNSFCQGEPFTCASGPNEPTLDALGYPTASSTSA